MEVHHLIKELRDGGHSFEDNELNGGSIFLKTSESGMLNLGNQLHMECLWFCFSSIIQKDLDGVIEHWNTHRIRRSRHGTVPGVPDVLYFLPETSGRSDCKVEVTDKKIAGVDTYSQNMNIPPPDINEYEEYSTYVLENERLFLPTNFEEGFHLFQTLLNFAAGIYINVKLFCVHMHQK